MSTKDKLLEALDVTIADLLEERLLDLLLDAFKEKDRQIKKLEADNCHERLVMQSERESMMRERERMLLDPLCCAQGTFYFLHGKQKFAMSIQGQRIDLYERKNGNNFFLQGASHLQWEME